MWHKFSADQEAGARFLASRKVALLGDKPGFGKTAQVVRACEYVTARPTVTVICPPQLVENWCREWRAWSLFGGEATPIKSATDEIPEHGLVAVSYQLACRPGVKNALRKRGCDVLILDEAHAIKDRAGSYKRTILNADGIAASAGALWFATASPAQNDASEWYVFAKAFGAWEWGHSGFVDRFCRQVSGSFGSRIVGNQNCEELKAMLRPFVLCRASIEADRAPLTVDDLEVPGAVPPEAVITPDELARVNEAIDLGDFSILDSPSVSTSRRLIGSAKAAGVADIVARELCQHDAAIVFCQYRPAIDIISSELENFGVGVIDGRCTPKKKQALVDSFQAGTGPSVLVCHGRSAGEGLTLTAGTRLIIAEPSWNPEDNRQQIARPWRRGQTKPVHASLCWLPGSTDDAVRRVMYRKAVEMDKIDMSR